jgi:hypothetical protein
MLSRPIRAATSVLLGALLVLASILPAFAYNEENVVHVRLVALDATHCGAPPIRLRATLTDRFGNPVAGAQVNFTLKMGVSGDVVAPASDVSNAMGQAFSSIQMTSQRGVRQVLASVAPPGKAKDQLTFSAAAHPGCFGRPGGGGIVLPPTTALPPTGGVLPATSTAEEVVRVVARNLPIGAALAVALGVLTLLYVMRRARGSRSSRTR